MTYRPVRHDNKLRKEILADSETRAIYEATKLQIDLAMKLQELEAKNVIFLKHKARHDK